MKFITREVKTYTYTFGRVDVTSGTISDIRQITSIDSLSKRAIDDLIKDHSLGLHIDTKETSEMYCMPVDVFVQEATLWMANNEERPYSMKDADQTTIDIPE